MPIADRKPTAPPATPVNIPQTAKETQLTIVADRNSVPVDSLVAYLDGSPWTVDWYSQLIGKHNDLRELDLGQNAAFQQYQKIAALELRVSAALQSSYEQENAITSVTGTATVMYVVPNVSDYFIADSGSQKKGLFRITNVERKTFNRDSVYEVNYSLVKYITNETEEYINLEAKVVRTYRFSKDRLVEGITPILTEDVYQLSVNLGQKYHSLVQKYFRDFMNRAKMTLNIPGQQFRIYDSRIVDFVIALIDSQETPERRDLMAVSMDHEKYLKQPSLWTLFLDRNYNDFDYIRKMYYLTAGQSFCRSSWIKGPAFWSFDYYVYPADSNTEASSIGDAEPMPSGGMGLSLTQTDLVNNEVAIATNVNPIPIIKKTGVDGYYVLSKDFYEQTENLSALEILIKDYLKGQTIDLSLLTTLIDHYPTWPVLERFYYGPIIMLLVKDAVRGFY